MTVPAIFCLFFFFQAEDGIRDLTVTGVQTCALPISSDAMSAAIMNVGSGVIQFKNLDLVAALATPAEITAIGALPGVQGVYANKQLTWETAMLHESVPSIRADAVQASGITGKGIGIAILDSGIDGLYNPDLHYPDKTVQ